MARARTKDRAVVQAVAETTYYIGDVVADAAFRVEERHPRGDGPWKMEADKVAWKDPATGLDCIIRRAARGGYLCGYVAVPPGHPLFGFHGDALEALGIQPKESGHRSSTRRARRAGATPRTSIGMPTSGHVNPTPKENEMKAPDMSGVDPLRWAEVRNRIAVVDSFLSLEGTTEADLLDHAARLGIRRTQFLKLVRAWKAHGTAVAIAGSRPVRKNPRIGWRALPEASERIMRETLEGLGPDLRPSVATAAVVEVLASRGLQTPDPSTVWRRLMTMRQERGGVGDAGVVVVAECRVRLPVLLDDVVAMPSLLIAARTGDGVVVAALPLDGVGPDFAGFGLAAIAAAASGRITIDRDFAARIGNAGDRLLPVRPGIARTTLSRVVGRAFGRLELQFNRTGAPAARLLKTKEDRPLGPDDARRVLEHAIGRHNLGRGGSGAFGLLGGTSARAAGQIVERRN